MFCNPELLTEPTEVQSLTNSYNKMRCRVKHGMITKHVIKSVHLWQKITSYKTK